MADLGAGGDFPVVKVVVFDMDGVLVDPTESFRRVVIETVLHFTGRETTFARIAQIKNEGGYNDDADVALRIVEELGGKATRDALFLSSFDVTRLPQMMIASALLSILI